MLEVARSSLLDVQYLCSQQSQEQGHLLRVKRFKERGQDVIK